MFDFYLLGKEVGIEKKKLLINNLSHSDKKVIEYFSKRYDLIITNAEKRGAIVILDVEDHVVKANNQLKHELFYHRLNEDPTTKHSETVNTAIEKFSK